MHPGVPAVVDRAVGLRILRAGHAADDQDVLGAGGGHVQQVPVFLRLEALFRRKQRIARRAAFVLAPEHRKMGRRSLILRPVAQDAAIVARRFAVIGVEQHDDRRFQSLGAVDGQNPHRIDRGVDAGFIRRIVVGPVLQRAQRVDEFRQARITAGIQIQRQFGKRLDIADHLAARQRGGRLRIAAEQFALMQDQVQQIMHRQARRGFQPARQYLAGPVQRRRGAVPCRDGRLQPQPPAGFAALRQRDQVGIVGIDDRGFQHMGQRPIVAGRDQEAQQRDQVGHFQRLQQAAALVGHERNAGLAQCALVRAQVLALFHQQHHFRPAHRLPVAPLRAEFLPCAQDRLRDRPAFIAPARIFLLVARAWSADCAARIPPPRLSRAQPGVSAAGARPHRCARPAWSALKKSDCRRSWH